MSCLCIMLLIVWSAHFISLAVVELQFYKLVYLFGYAHYIHLHFLAGQLVWPLNSIGTFETKCLHIYLCLRNDHFDGNYYPTPQSIKTTKYINPFIPKSDQFQISPAASPAILHHTVWRTRLFIAYSDERWLYYQFSLPHLYISV